MTTTALGSALSGLRLAQKALDVTSSNISNASIEGYTRKTLHQESVITDGIGVGVRFGEIGRYVDYAVQRDYRGQLGLSSYLNTREGYLSRIIAVHGSTDQEQNISAQLNRLYSGFVALSSEPDSRNHHATLLAQAGQVTKSFGDFHNKLLEMRNETQIQLQAEVQELNLLLGQIADLNLRIKQDHVMGKSTAALEDIRDEAVKKVAQQMEITYFTDGDGVLVVQTPQGQVLADTEARPVTFQSTLVSPASLYPEDINGIILELNGADHVDLASKKPGGRIGALLDLRDGELVGYMTQLDELAHKLMQRFDEQGLRLFTDPSGVVPPDVPSQYVGIAGAMIVNPQVVADPAVFQQGTGGVPINTGSNEVIMRIVNYTFGRTRDAAGTPHAPFNVTGLGARGTVNIAILGDPNASLIEFSNALLDNQAKDYTLTKTTLETSERYTREVENRLLESSAVNTDEELARMIELQKSYSANAKMIGALDELFRDLLNAI